MRRVCETCDTLCIFPVSMQTCYLACRIHENAQPGHTLLRRGTGTHPPACSSLRLSRPGGQRRPSLMIRITAISPVHYWRCSSTKPTAHITICARRCGSICQNHGQVPGHYSFLRLLAKGNVVHRGLCRPYTSVSMSYVHKPLNTMCTDKIPSRT